MKKIWFMPYFTTENGLFEDLSVDFLLWGGLGENKHISLFSSSFSFALALALDNLSFLYFPIRPYWKNLRQGREEAVSFLPSSRLSQIANDSSYFRWYLYILTCQFVRCNFFSSPTRIIPTFFLFLMIERNSMLVSLPLKLKRLNSNLERPLRIRYRLDSFHS